MQSTNPEHTQGFSVSNPFTRFINYCPHDVPWEKVTNAEALRTHCLRRGLLDDRDVPALQQRLKEYQQAHKDENEDRGVPWRLTPDEAWILANATRTRCQLIQVVDKSYVGSWGRWLEKRFTLHTRRLGLFTVIIRKSPTCFCLGNQNAFLLEELDYIFAANPFFYFFPNQNPGRVPQVNVVPSPACVICFQEAGSIPLQECTKCDEKHWACPEWVCSPQSEPEKWIDKEHMDKSLHETKLAAMLNYEYKSRRHK
ncbi:hypothetical protein NEUTE1DRAFT_99961 [Neurospora tetrasperma FGSC 2508]|uniref:Uncharacterized protein n=1 Tax=Neurospora tetrasperma (strain FGSC 2508 / ATCC MYA-4615 / P0657) TaxID=510951 RepID=F8MIK8_NEUT8|nr:uncharacterized protein NEUTE1DRAFT_99961 [Neurospora tetrasperma FGSC 2508]EGO59809.1 hypothetical protein NEUTE1DRAFT_99961 [Neurospora tetrasperma FGSC 2508]